MGGRGGSIPSGAASGRADTAAKAASIVSSRVERSSPGTYDFAKGNQLRRGDYLIFGTGMNKSTLHYVTKVSRSGDSTTVTAVNGNGDTRTETLGRLGAVKRVKDWLSYKKPGT